MTTFGKLSNLEMKHKFDYCENKINKLVYQFYNLTEEEIKIRRVIMEIEKFDKTLEDLVFYFKVSRSKIFDALFLLLADSEDLENQGDLWDVDISYEKALNLLSYFDFNTLQNKVIIENNIIPKEFAFSTKARIKNKGKIWYIHKNDKDPNPSNPHAHNIDQNIKLDLSNGECFRKRKLLFKLNKKEFLSIRKKAEVIYEGVLPTILI